MAYDTALFNADPYYDDYDRTKKFLRMMFRPGYGVQARELTQLQTILQNQISEFGNSVFAESSMVLNGQITENYLKYARVYGLTGTTNISDFIGTQISSPGYATATVIHAERGLSSGDVDSVLFFQYDNGVTAFANQIQIGATSSNNVALSATISPGTTYGNTYAYGLGNAVLISVDEGVRYTDGFFVYHDTQKIAACSITGGTASPVRIFDNPTCSIGFTKTKSFITADDDSTLNDPAYGYYNYAAPGANRYKINLVIGRDNFDSTTVGLTSEGIQNFARDSYIEFIRVQDGVTIKKEKYPEYSVVEDTLARRTYDESGNYTVRPFDLNLVTGTTASTLGASIGPGKAYIFGYELETQAPTTLQLNKARDIYTQPITQFNNILGSFVGGTVGSNTNLTGFDISSMPLVLLSSSSGAQAFAQIGSARVRGLERPTSSANLYLFDISMSAGATFGNVKTAFIPGVTASGQQFFNITQTNGKTVLQGNDSLLWQVPAGKAVKEINDVDYSFTTHFTPVTISSSAGASGTIDLTTKTLIYSANTTRFPVASVPTSFPNSDVRLYGMSGHELNGNYVSTATGMTFNSVTYSSGTAYTGNAYAVVSTLASYSGGYKKRTKTFTTETITITGSGANAWQGFRYDVGTQPYFFLSSSQTSPNVDVVRVISITGTYNGSSTNVNQFFTLDTGQRDAYYDWSRLVLAPGYTAGFIGTSLSGPFTVTLERFAHNNSASQGPFTVDSYITGAAFGYENIPSYTSPKTGIKYELRDVVDYRPDRTGSIPSATGTSITGSFYSSIMSVPNGQNSFSYTHYLPRTDKIVLTRDRNFQIVEGISDIYGTPPQDNPDSMTLYTVTLNPYTFSPSDSTYRYYNNKRYTMKDINDLEKRINNIEYYTTLSLLEQEAKSLEILDAATNLSIPKKGILVDSFRGHNIADVQDPNYNASIDYENTVLRPAFIDRIYRLGITGTGLGGNITTTYSGITSDNTVTIFNTLSPQIVQPIATSTVTVNPMGVANYLGSMRLYPSSDFWYDDTKDPIVKVNIAGENDNWESICARGTTSSGKGGGFGTQYNDWESNWSGINRIDETNTDLINKTPSRSISARTSGVNFGNSNYSMLPETLRSTNDAVTDDRIVRKDILPYARNITVAITAEGLKPNTTVYAFLDGKGITTGRLYELTSSGGLSGTVESMTTNSSGKLIPASGGFYGFVLNNGTEPVITAGAKLLRITDSPTDDKTTTTTAADQMFYIEGSYGSKTSDISSTRKPVIRRESVSSEDIITNIFFRENQRKGMVQLKGFIDPLSQTFTVNPTLYPCGIMIKKIGIFFKSKASNNQPITLVIKPTVNGYPHPSKILPFAISTVYPANVNTSVDANSGNNPETLFDFSTPVYLLPGKEYSISLLTNTTEYSVFTSVSGQTVLGLGDTKKIATKQPFIGSMFKAQNASTLVKVDDENIKFAAYACDFGSSSSGVVQLATLPDTQGVYGSGSINLDEIRLNVPVLLPPNTTISFSSNLSGISYLLNEKTTPLKQRTTILPSSSSFFGTNINIATSNRWVAPIIDYDRAYVNAIENIVTSNPTNEVTANSIDYTNSRYITKRVTLEQPATNLNVYLSLTNPYPSSVDVYYRYLPVGSDNSLLLDDQNYIKIPQTTGSLYSDKNIYRETCFGMTGTTGFSNFAVKIVMKSSDGTIIPKLENMRIVAT